MPDLTSLFHLPVPSADDINWGQTLLDWFAQAETTLGCNTNLALTAEGNTTRLRLGHISGIDSVDDVEAETWGRVVIQTTMVPGSPVLCRLIGITDVLGLETDAVFGQTVYHHANEDWLTIHPENAVRVADGRLEFLPLGFAFDGGTQAFVYGLLPVQYCPTVMSGAAISHKDGSNNPAASWTAGSFVTGFIVQSIEFDGAGQDIDLVFPFCLPGDFQEFPSLEGEDYWAFKIAFETTGGATLRVYSVADSDGTEHVLATAGAASVGVYDDLIVDMATLEALEGVWTPGTMIYVRLKAAGGTSEVVSAKSLPLLQYFPLVAWYLN